MIWEAFQEERLKKKKKRERGRKVGEKEGKRRRGTEQIHESQRGMVVGKERKIGSKIDDLVVKILGSFQIGPSEIFQYRWGNIQY